MTDPGPVRADCTRVVVADAGPLIHLDELGCRGLLSDFGEIRIATAVWDEVARHRQAALEHVDLALLRCAPEAHERVNALSVLFTLHAGEREALCLCLEFGNALLLTDDTAARLAARSLAVEARGTLGLLVRAIRRRQLSKAAVLDLLRQIPERSTLHIRPGLLDDIVRQVAGLPEVQ